ncbi:MAG TPA: ornithine cyclodeaminase family protein [Thermoanaerobaculia bacterium]|nr:ornithine cyclodeaminase family protein [Thermoanaerobaculia bacterium]
MNDKVLLLNEEQVHHLLTPAECIEAMESALIALARGEVYNPLRQLMRPPGASGVLGLMPAYRSGNKPVFALKEVAVFPGNPARGLDSHLGAVLLHSGETGQLLGVFNAAAITAIRTAAVSALATRLLSRQESTTLTIIGAGVQARAHAESIASVRALKGIRLASRGSEKAQKLAGELTSRLGIECTFVADIRAALEGADIIVTATSSNSPILKREWIGPGAHINAVGSSVRSAREIDGATMAASRLFVDRRESTLNESGDYLSAEAEGLIGPGHIVAEIGEILIGTHKGRISEGEITLFKSLGLAAEDLAAAEFLLEKAKRLEFGTWASI